MKVALITIHVSLNYGAMMQTYATARILKQLGYEVELIDIRIHTHNFLLSFLWLPKILKYKKFIRKFYPPMTRRYKTVQDLLLDPPKANIYMVGSDQVWNPAITKSISDAFFLPFGNKYIQRISFASSFGTEKWELNKYETKKIKEYLHSFNYISVRENIGKKICNEIFDLSNVKVVLDPTLLFLNGYPELTGDIKEKKIITIYKLVPDRSFYLLAKSLANRINMDIRIIGKLIPVKKYRYNYPCGVEGWIKSIAESSIVLTDSYHGIIFSILYKRKFIAFMGNPSRMSRLINILEELDLLNRLCVDLSNVEQLINIINTPIDYDKIHKKLALLKDESLSFLKNSLKS